MTRGNRKYEVEIVARTSYEIQLIDEALEMLAAQGIWVHSLRETHPPTGAVLTPLALSEQGAHSDPIVGL